MSLESGRFISAVTKNVGYQYYIYLPEGYEATSKKGLPLILFLHGMGQRGDDLEQVKKNGPLYRVEEGFEFPFLIVAPQCPDNHWWDSDNLIALLDYIAGDYRVDCERVYLTGLSMGGSGVWALANSQPERFAAIAPISGFFTPVDPRRLKGLPIWCFHGAMDDIVPVNDSLRMVAWIREHGGIVKLTVYPDTGHNAWIQAYNDPSLYGWFLEHKRSL